MPTARMGPRKNALPHIDRDGVPVGHQLPATSATSGASPPRAPPLAQLPRPPAGSRSGSRRQLPQDRAASLMTASNVSHWGSDSKHRRPAWSYSWAHARASGAGTLFGTILLGGLREALQALELIQWFAIRSLPSGVARHWCGLLEHKPLTIFTRPAPPLREVTGQVSFPKPSRPLAGRQSRQLSRTTRPS